VRGAAEVQSVEDGPVKIKSTRSESRHSPRRDARVAGGTAAENEPDAEPLRDGLTEAGRSALEVCARSGSEATGCVLAGPGRCRECSLRTTSKGVSTSLILMTLHAVVWSTWTTTTLGFSDTSDHQAGLRARSRACRRQPRPSRPRCLSGPLSFLDKPVVHQVADKAASGTRSRPRRGDVATHGMGRDAAWATALTLCRWLPLVKWLLAIPHYIVLFFLEIAAFFAVIVTSFAILFTGRYPRGIFSFVEGIFRWHNRVAAYAFVLVTDRYPPFRLAP
jgi:hypothetical protein